MGKKIGTKTKYKLSDWTIELGSMDKNDPKAVYVNFGKYFSLNPDTEVNAVREHIRLKREVERLVELSDVFSNFLVDFARFSSSVIISKPSQEAIDKCRASRVFKGVENCPIQSLTNR